METLSPLEVRTLESLERTIEAGLDAWKEVSEALAIISGQRLWRADYASFDEYCRTRWGMTSRRAYQLAAASDVQESLGTIVPNEAQARELYPLSTEQRQQVWSEATQDGTVTTTAATLRELAAEARAALPDQSERDKVEQEALYERGLNHVRLALAAWKGLPGMAEPLQLLEDVIQWDAS